MRNADIRYYLIKYKSHYYKKNVKKSYNINQKKYRMHTIHHSTQEPMDSVQMFPDMVHGTERVRDKL